VATYGIKRRVPRCKGLRVTAEHLATLRSISRRFPAAMILRTQVGFGVSLAASRYLDVLFTPNLSDEDLADLFEAFAILLRADPAVLTRGIAEHVGPS
jgi:hypothetical protein